MIEESFEFEGIKGTVRLLPLKRAESGESQYIAAILRANGINVPVTELLDDVYLTDTFNKAREFGRTAVYMQDVIGLPFEWPHSTSKPAEIDVAFQWWMDYEGGLWDHIRDMVAKLRRPNGVAGARPEELTPIEANDPLSSKSVKAGAKVSSKS